MCSAKLVPAGSGSYFRQSGSPLVKIPNKDTTTVKCFFKILQCAQFREEILN